MAMHKKVAERSGLTLLCMTDAARVPEDKVLGTSHGLDNRSELIEGF